jgi:hypothetical protein
MLQPEEITEEQWRKAMSTYHKMIRKEPGMAWQAVCAAVINLFVEAQQMEACRRAREMKKLK